MAKKNKAVKEEQQMLTAEELTELAILEEELYLLKKEKGLLKEKKGIFKFIDRYFHGDKGNEPVKPKVKEPCIVNRKKYFWFLCISYDFSEPGASAEVPMSG